MTIQQPVLAEEIRFISLSASILYQINHANSEVLILANYFRLIIPFLIFLFYLSSFDHLQAQFGDFCCHSFRTKHMETASKQLNFSNYIYEPCSQRNTSSL